MQVGIAKFCPLFSHKCQKNLFHGVILPVALVVIHFTKNSVKHLPVANYFWSIVFTINKYCSDSNSKIYLIHGRIWALKF